MKKLSLVLIAILFLGLASESTAGFFTWRYREHATDCTSLTDGKNTDLCYEIDSDTVYKCEPSVGDCNTVGEWKQVVGAGGGMIVGGAITSGTANRVLYEDSGNLLAEDIDLQFNGTTLTANTVDINGGTIDATRIGSASATDATFSFISLTNTGLEASGKIIGHDISDTFSFDGDQLANYGLTYYSSGSYGGIVGALSGYRGVLLMTGGSPRIVADFTGHIGIATRLPDKQLEVNLGTTDALRLSYNDSNGSAATYVDTTLSSAGVVTHTAVGSAPSFVFAGGAIDSTKIGSLAAADATFSSATVTDSAYSSAWNGSNLAPTRNAVYDKIETIAGGGIGGTLTNRANNYAARSTESTTNTVEDSYLRLDDNGTAYVMTSALTGGEYIEIKPGASSIVKGWNTSRLVLGSDAGQVWFGDVTGAIPTTVWNTAGVGGNQTQMRPTSGNDFYIEQQSSSNNGTVFFQTLGAGKMSVNIEDALSATDATFTSVNGAKIGNTSAKDATFTNVTVTGSIDGSKIGKVTPADATFSSISIGANTLGSFPVTTSLGGTGSAGGFSLYSPIFAPSTTTGIMQSGTLGSAGNVLTSNGAGALPTFKPNVGLNLAATQTASFTAVNGNLYPINLSGAGADFVVTFPASPSTGDRFGWFVKTAHASNTYGCEALSTTSIRGSTSHDNTWSTFQIGERLDFFYDGSTWQVDRDGRIPFACRIELTADVTGEVANTQTAVGFDSEVYDNGSFYDAVTNKKATIKRRNPYRISIAVYSVNNVSATNTLAVCVTDAVPTSSVSYIHPNVLSGAASTGRVFGATRTGILSVGTPVTTWFASTEGSRGVDATTSVAAKSFFAMEEILE